MPQESEKANDAVVVAQGMHKALTIDRAKASCSVKPDFRWVFLERLPTRWADAVMAKALAG